MRLELWNYKGDYKLKSNNMPSEVKKDQTNYKKFRNQTIEV